MLCEPQCFLFFCLLALIPWIDHLWSILLVTLQYDMCYGLTIWGLMFWKMFWIVWKSYYLNKNETSVWGNFSNDGLLLLPSSGPTDLDGRKSFFCFHFFASLSHLSFISKKLQINHTWDYLKCLFSQELSLRHLPKDDFWVFSRNHPLDINPTKSTGISVK